MWICSCKAVTDHEINDLLASPAVNDEVDVGLACGAGTECGGCVDEVRQLCEQARAVDGTLVTIG
jgi:bacterioferritin-associated ferredoxin